MSVLPNIAVANRASAPVVGDLYVRDGGAWIPYPAPVGQGLPADEGLFAWHPTGNPYEVQLAEVIEVWARRNGRWTCVYGRVGPPPAAAVSWRLTANSSGGYTATAAWTVSASSLMQSVRITRQGQTVDVPYANGTYSFDMAAGDHVDVTSAQINTSGIVGVATAVTLVAPYGQVTGLGVSVAHPGARDQYLSVSWSPVVHASDYEIEVSWTSNGAIPAQGWAKASALNIAAHGVPLSVSDSGAQVPIGVPSAVSVRVRPKAPAGSSTTTPWSTFGPVTPDPRPPQVVATDTGQFKVVVDLVPADAIAGQTFELEYNRNAAGWTGGVAVTSTSATPSWTFAHGDRVEVRARTLAGGRTSAWEVAPAVSVTGLLAPTGLARTSSSTDYTHLAVKWAAVSGASGYEVQLLNSGGSVVSSQSRTASQLTASFAVSKDVKYQVRVRALAGTDAGPYTAALRWQVGHPAVTSTRNVSKTRAYNSGMYPLPGGGLVRDTPWGINPPGNVRVTSIDVSLGATHSSTLTNASRALAWYAHGVEVAWYPGIPSPSAFTYVLNDSHDGVYGIIARGSGWSTAASTIQRVEGWVRVMGVETYTARESYTSTAAASGKAW